MSDTKIGLSFLIGGIVGSSFSSSMKNIKSSINDVNTKIKNLSEIKVNLRKQLNLDGVSSSKIKEELDQITEKINELKYTDSVDQFKSNGAKFLGVATLISGAAGSIINAYQDVAQAQGEIASLGIGESGLKAITDEARAFSNTWAGVSTAEFIRASYDIKSGISSLTDEGVAELTRMAALTGTATKATVAQMTQLFAQGYGVFKDEFSSESEFAKGFSNAISASVQAFRTDGADLIGAISSLGRVAKASGINLSEQLAIIGVSKETFGTASEAATGYKAFLDGVGKAQEKLGLKLTDSTGKMLPMVEILEKIKTKYGGSISEVWKSDELKQAFGSAEAVKSIKALIDNTEGLKLAQANLEEQMLKGTVTEEMAKSMQRGKEFALISSQFTNIMSELGGMIYDVILPAINAVSKGLNTLAKLIAENRELVSSFVKLGSYIAGACIGFYAFRAAIYGVKIVSLGLFTTFARLGGMFVSFKSILLGLFATLVKLGSMFVSFAGAIVGLVPKIISLVTIFKSLSLALFTTPFGWVILGVTALAGAGYFLIKNWQSVKEFFIGVWDNIVNAFNSGVEYISNILKKAVDIWLAPFKAVGKVFDTIKGYFGSSSSKIDINNNSINEVSGSGVVGKYYNSSSSQAISNKSNMPVTYSPQIIIQGNANKSDVASALDNSKIDFIKRLKETQEQQTRLNFSGAY